MNKTISEALAILEKKKQNLTPKTGNKEMDEARLARLVEVAFAINLLRDAKYRHEMLKELDVETINK